MPASLAAAAVSAAGAGVAGDRSTGVSAHNVSIYTARRTASDVKDASCLLPGRAGVPHAGRLARLRVVRDDSCISCCRSGNLAAFDVQRKTLLVSRIEIRRRPVRTLREPQSLCGICRIGFADVTGTFAFGPRAP